MIGHFKEKNGKKYLVLDDQFQKNMKKFVKELKKKLKR